MRLSKISQKDRVALTKAYEVIVEAQEHYNDAASITNQAPEVVEMLDRCNHFINWYNNLKRS